MSKRKARGAGARPFLLLSIAPLCWAGNHILARAVAGDVPPGGMAVLRWLLAAAVLLPFAWPHLVRERAALAAKPWTIVLLSMAGGGVFGTMQFIALQHTVALNAAVFNSTVPVFIVAAGGLIFRDPVRSIQVLGLGVSMLGVIAIVVKGDAAALSQLRFNFGDLLLIANMALFAIYSACLRLKPGMHWTTFLVAFSLVSAIGNLPLAVWEHLDGEPLVADWPTALSVLYAGLITSVAAYATWARGIESIGAARAGVFLHLVPLYGALLSWLLLGEPVQLYHVAGLALILSGVFLAARR